jgi:hypothetical protein
LRSLGSSYVEKGRALRKGRVLAHGKKVRVKGIVCTSSAKGMRCLNSAKHGFQVGPRAVRRF